MDGKATRLPQRHDVWEEKLSFEVDKQPSETEVKIPGLVFL